MKKQIVMLLMASAFTLMSASSVFAAPTNPQKADNNPQEVAYYTSGNHGVAGEPYLHTGTDAVYSAGNSGNFQQWFYGSSAEPNQPTEGDHSVWKSVGDTTTCDAGWTFVPNASASWGSYLQPGNYCVHTNDYHIQQ